MFTHRRNRSKDDIYLVQYLPGTYNKKVSSYRFNPLFTFPFLEFKKGFTNVKPPWIKIHNRKSHY